MKKLLKKDRFLVVIACLIVNSSKIVFSIIYANPGLQTAQDLFSLLQGSAYCAGRDWTEIGREYGAYYGYGFIILFSGLYRVFSDGLLIYRIILVICHLLTVISSLFVYKIINVANIKLDRYTKILICVACTYVQEGTGCGIINELPLNMLIWIIMYLLMKLCVLKNKKGKIKYTCILGVAVAYSCTVHARAIVLYPLIILCVIIIRMIGKKGIVHIPSALMLCSLLIPYFLLTKRVQDTLLGGEHPNSSIIAKAQIGAVSEFSMKKFCAILYAIATYIHETTLLSAGIALVGLICIFFLIKKVYENHKMKCLFGESDIAILCGTFFSLCGIGVFILGLCYSGRNELFEGFYMNNNEQLRVLTLIRYFAPFIGPFILSTFLACICICKEYHKKILKWAFIIFWVMQNIFLFFIYPKINYTGWGSGIYLQYTGDKEMTKSEIYLVGGFLVMTLIFTFSYWSIYRKNWRMVCVFLIMHSFVSVTYRQYHMYVNSNAFFYVDGGYRYFLRDEQINDIYVVIDSQKDGEERQISSITNYYFLYQILLPNKHIIPGQIPEGVESAVVLADNPLCVSDYESYEIIQLDDNEWVMKR